MMSGSGRCFLLFLSFLDFLDFFLDDLLFFRFLWSDEEELLEDDDKEASEEDGERSRLDFLAFLSDEDRSRPRGGDASFIASKMC